LDSVPFPDYTDFHLSDDVFGLMFLAYLSRGCPYDCRFCNERVISGKRFRQKSVSRFSEEVSEYQQRYNVNSIYFCDSAINAVPAQMQAMADTFEGSGLSWFGEAVLRTASRSVCENMARSGCRWVGVGVESGSDRLLKLMNKGITVTEIMFGINEFLHAGITIATYWVVGYPGETITNFAETKVLVEKVVSKSPIALVFPCTLGGNTFIKEHFSELDISLEPQPLPTGLWKDVNEPWHSRGHVGWSQYSNDLDFEERLKRKKLLEKIIDKQGSSDVFTFPDSLLAL